jgi:predicted mannosyl-3-phosphoglycerate phosphatase (HAD superfamily)
MSLAAIEQRLLTSAAARERLAGVRVVYTDLDGTMLGRGASFFHGPDGEPTFEPAEMLLAAGAAGIDVVPASGRSLFGLVRDARLLGLSTVIAEMGALIAYDTGRQIVHAFGPTPGGDGEMPVRTMERTGTIDLLLSTYAGRLELHEPWTAWRDCTQIFRGLVDVAEVDRLLEREGHGWVALVDNGMLFGAQPSLQLGPREAHVYHLVPRGTTKGSAVALDRERRGFALEACVAVGDATADLEIAPHVSILVIVRDAAEQDPKLLRLALARDNVFFTQRPMNLGWVDTLRAVLG